MTGSVEEQVRSIFDKSSFVRELGIELLEVHKGLVRTHLHVRDSLLQQHGFVHAGIVATLADHTAGGAARSVSGSNDVITVEFKINFLRPAAGKTLSCCARVVSGGKNLIVADAEVFCRVGSNEKMVARLTETLAVIRDR